MLNVVLGSMSKIDTSSLMRAVWNHDPASVRTLLKAKVDINAVDRWGKTALDYAATEEIKALLLGN